MISSPAPVFLPYSCICISSMRNIYLVVCNESLIEQRPLGPDHTCVGSAPFPPTPPPPFLWNLSTPCTGLLIPFLKAVSLETTLPDLPKHDQLSYQKPLQCKLSLAYNSALSLLGKERGKGCYIRENKSDRHQKPHYKLLVLSVNKIMDMYAFLVDCLTDKIAQC